MILRPVLGAQASHGRTSFFFFLRRAEPRGTRIRECDNGRLPSTQIAQVFNPEWRRRASTNLSAFSTPTWLQLPAVNQHHVEASLRKWLIGSEARRYVRPAVAHAPFLFGPKAHDCWQEHKTRLPSQEKFASSPECLRVLSFGRSRGNRSNQTPVIPGWGA